MKPEESMQDAVERALAEDREAALRDVFAASALAALLMRTESPVEDAVKIARQAFYLSEVMLKVRVE